jgi:type I site-specific restriction endonuclease
VAVTVDMIATGTDIKPVEIVVFMRSVKSRSFFEQMKGRGVRVCKDDDLRSVNPGEHIKKDHFVIVDCVGVCERDKTDSRPMDAKKSVPLDKLLQAKSLGKCVPAGATVFAKIGEALRLNRRVMLGRDALVDNNVMGLVPKREKVSPKYLYYFMQTVDLGELSRSTTVPSIRKSDVVEISIPVPRLAAQDQIVAELEKQFSRLDEAVANLQRVKANLKRYKASVLKAGRRTRATAVQPAQHSAR